MWWSDADGESAASIQEGPGLWDTHTLTHGLSPGFVFGGDAREE